MADDAINELISSVAHRGTAIGVSTPPEQIRHIYSRDRWYRRGVRHRSLLGRRVSVVIVAALILAVFFAPLPHVSLFSHIVAPETRPTTTAPTATTLPAAEVTPAAIWVVGATTVWAWWTSGEAQGIERSNDAGHSWSNATPPELDKQLGDHFIKGFYALGAEHAWVTYGGVGSSARQTIASSSDGGRQWTVLGRSPSAYGCELQFATPADGWCTVIGAAAGSESVQIYRTEDGGRHWRSVYNNGPGGKTALGGLPFGCDKNVQFVNTTVGWAIFLCNGGLAPLYETTDGGTTWVRRGVAAPSFPFIDGGFADVPDLFGRTGAVGYTFHVGSSVRRSVVYVSERGCILARSRATGSACGVDSGHHLTTNLATREWRPRACNRRRGADLAIDHQQCQPQSFVRLRAWDARNRLRDREDRLDREHLEYRHEDAVAHD